MKSLETNVRTFAIHPDGELLAVAFGEIITLLQPSDGKKVNW